MCQSKQDHEETTLALLFSVSTDPSYVIRYNSVIIDDIISIVFSLHYRLSMQSSDLLYTTLSGWDTLNITVTSNEQYDNGSFTRGQGLKLEIIKVLLPQQQSLESIYVVF